MADAVTWETLRELAEFRARSGCAVSLHIGLDPSESPTPSAVAERVDSLLDAAHKEAVAQRPELSHEQRKGLDDDVARLRAYFGEEFDRSGTHGAAVFAAGLDGVFRTLLLAEPLPDAVKIGRTFSIAALVPLVDHAHPALVAFVGRERGRLYRVEPGRLDEVMERDEAVPGRHDQGGRSQARFQRSIDEQAEAHLRHLAEDLVEQVRRLRKADVVVVGSDPTRQKFVDLLPQEARQAVAGETTAEAHAGPVELLEVATPILVEARARRERELLDRWREEAARGGRASVGWADTLEAASDEAVELLLFQPGSDREAYECPKDGRAYASAGECPLDGTTLEPVQDGIDLAVRLTVAHGGTALAVENGQDLDPVGGIGALLRFPV